MRKQPISLISSGEDFKIQHPIYIPHLGRILGRKNNIQPKNNPKTQSRKRSTRTFSVIKCIMYLKSILIYHTCL